MKDISARELKGHNILAVERFEDSTRWMIEFVVLHPCSAYGSRGDEMRLFLAEDSYQNALQDQQRRKIKIKRYIAATGRVRGTDDVIAYHVRQSFRPGEISVYYYVAIG